MKRVVIVIVNYRTAGLTGDCLASLARDEWVAGNCEVVVVENASGDGSAERLRGVMGQWAWMRLVVSERNGGFAAGNNVALREVVGGVPEFVLLLNPDTVVEVGAVGELVRFMEGRREVGIAGSRLMGLDGRAQTSAFGFHSVLGELEGGLRLGVASRLLSRWRVAGVPREEAHRTDWVAGASMLVRREVLEEVGLLDEGYFMYYEEVDFCWRARRAGWETWYVPASRVVHLVGQSSGVEWGEARALPRYWFDSRRRFFQKNHGRLYAVMAEGAYLLGLGLWRLRRMLQRRAGGAAGVEPNRMSGGWNWIVWPALCGR